MWDTLINYFSTLEQRPMERMAILVGGLLFFWIIEGAIPLLPMRYKKTKLNWSNFIALQSLNERAEGAFACIIDS